MINLKEIITKYPECMESANKLRSFLVDLYPEEKARIRVIVDSFDCGIYEQMKGADLADKLFISGLCKKLESEYGYSNALSIWCIEQWAKIFNKDLVISAPIFDTEKECVESKKNADTYKNIKVGDIITLGQYPQGANGEIKPVEWQVLAVEKGKALVISKYALDCIPFNERFTDVTWEISTLRKWLNNEFYNKSFTASDKIKVATTIVVAHKNPHYNTYQGNNTQDNVFLLSTIEAEEFFNSNKARKCVPTDYAKARGAFINSNYTIKGKATCWWWCRSPGRSQVGAAGIDYDGSISFDGVSIRSVNRCLRPAIWIKI